MPTGHHFPSNCNHRSLTGQHFLPMSRISGETWPITWFHGISYFTFNTESEVKPGF
jgi:hypothetical protein